MVVIKLFTSPTCPYRPRATEIVRRITNETDSIALEFPVNTENGLREALRFGIRVVPTLVINDELGIVGVPEEGELRKLIKTLKGGVNEGS